MWMSGVARLKFILADLALSSVLKLYGEGYQYDYCGLPIKLRRKEHFKELILEVDLIKGYCDRRDVKQDDVVVDAGGYPGEFAVYAARKASRVIVLEPVEENAEILIQNIKLNDLDNVKVIQKELWSSEGRVPFSNVGLLNSAVEPDGPHEVVATTLDAVVREHSLERLDFVKMDVEGAELQVLKGSTKVMEMYQPFLR